MANKTATDGPIWGHRAIELYAAPTRPCISTVAFRLQCEGYDVSKSAVRRYLNSDHASLSLNFRSRIRAALSAGAKAQQERLRMMQRRFEEQQAVAQPVVSVNKPQVGACAGVIKKSTVRIHNREYVVRHAGLEGRQVVFHYSLHDDAVVWFLHPDSRTLAHAELSKKIAWLPVVAHNSATPA